MTLIKYRYGKGRVRIMRVHRDGDTQDVSQLSLKVMLEGDFGRAYTDADNSTSTSTDTIKNIVNATARENTALQTEPFCQVLARRYIDLYPQAASVSIPRMRPNGAGCPSTARRIRTALRAMTMASRSSSWSRPATA